MLDTKLKKTHKLTIFIIALCVLLPALILVALYPRMEKSAIKQKENYQSLAEDRRDENKAQYKKELVSSFDNMAAEAAFYIYGLLLRDASGEYVDLSVLEEYGWIDDYYQIYDVTDFYAEMTVDTGSQIQAPAEPEETETPAETEVPDRLAETEEPAGLGETEVPAEPQSTVSVENAPVEGANITQQGSTAEGASGVYSYTNTSWNMLPLLDMARESKISEISSIQTEEQGYLQLEFDAYGEVSNVQMWMPEDVYVEKDLYGSIRSTIAKFRNNAEVWAYQNEKDIIAVTNNLIPKNFRVIFVLEEPEDFIHEYRGGSGYYYNTGWEQLYWDAGAFAPIMVLAVLVALAALLLPFIKRLDTGWEKLFSMPFEVVAALTFLGGMGAVGMYYVMCLSTMTDIQALYETHGILHVIGIPISQQVLYGLCLFANFLGWAACFLAEYVVVASLRQFLCRPVYYLKERLLCVRFFHWCKKQCIRLYHYIMEIDLTDNLNKSILKIVLINFLIVAFLCSIWFLGIMALLVYSVILFFVLKKYGEKLQRQYKDLLHATKQMAEGNLKIRLEEDLGVFKPLGEGLQQVQQGFSRAVAEEAKSQNMKTELITNVSHDLKTPLTAIITYIELLKEEDITDEERNSYIKTIDQKSQRLKFLIDDLFEVSKAASGNIQMNFMDVDVVNLMKQVRLEMEEKIRASQLSFRWNLPEEKVVLSLDGQKTYRVFENLLNNVLKYSMPQSRVYIDILDEKNSVRIVFRNISEVELKTDPKHLTDRFVRGDASRKTEGSGLGLAIVKSFVELQDGKLDISIDGDLFKVSILWQK